MNILKFTSGVMIIISFLISLFFGINAYSSICLIASIISSFLLILWIKNINVNYTNITMFFIVFSTLYGISGPINTVWGKGLPPLFSTPYNTNVFLISYSIANIGLIIGIIFYNLINNKSKLSNLFIEDEIKIVINNKKKILYVAIFLALLASIFEIINLIRAGGINVLFAGKAIYQSKTSDLTLTLPSSEIMTIAFAFMCLYLAITKGDHFKKYKLNIIQFILCSIPFICINIILGKRGELLNLFICIFIGITYFKPINDIKPKLVIILITLYVFLAFLYASRSIICLIPDNPQLFFETAFKKERLITALNPGSNEFGAAFGNYSEFYAKYSEDFNPKLGETYIKGVALLIPSFLYPGSKPKQITYEFRDEFFISEAKRGRIAGTAFSSILEAYMNFKYFGVFFIYLVIGYLLQKFDKKYKYKNLFFMILYITTFPITISFHRSAFGDIFSTFLFNALLIYLIVYISDLNNNTIVKIEKKLK